MINYLLMCVCVAVISLLTGVVIAGDVISPIVSSIIKPNIVNSKVLPKDILSRFEEYLVEEHIYKSVVVLNYAETIGTIEYRLGSKEFIVKLVGDKFQKI